jgi:tellurite resistance protein TehA-like permease
MSNMEPEVRDFLKRIVWSFFLGLSWMMLNMTLGIYFDLLFFRDGLRIGNILYYLFFVGSLSLLIWYYYKTWKKKFPHG